MGAALRRAVRRALLIGALACLLLSFVAPTSRAQEDDDGIPPPEVFRGAASSLAASVQADREALIPVPELFRFIALDGSGAYESSNQQARASIFFPGNGLILGPSLACGTFGGQFPEFFKPLLDACLQYKYPLTANADSFEPDSGTSGSLAFGSKTDPMSGNAGGAHAHAGPDAATTDAAMQDLRVLGLPAFGPVTPPIPGFKMDSSLITIDNATSRTDQRIVKGGLVVDSEATLSGVRMIGGLLNIGSIRSHSRVTDDAKGKQATDATLEVSGVTVAGVPAQITDQGLVVGSPNGAMGPLIQQLQTQANAMLEAFDVKVTALPIEKGKNDSGAATASVGGVLIEFGRDVQGAPVVAVPGPIKDPLPDQIPVNDADANGFYTGSFQLGSTAALGSAFTFDADAIDDSAVSDDGFVDLGSSTDDGSFDLAAPDVGDVSAPDATGSGATPGTRRAPQRLAGFVDELFGSRLGLLYLSFTLATLALCIAPRLALPARLPRYRP